MSDLEHAEHSHRGIVGAILLVLALYVLALATGWPQRGTQRITEASHATAASHSEPAAAGADERSAKHPPLWMVAPFALLLIGIAVLPLTPGASAWWDSNRNKFLVSGVLAALTLLYYLFLCRHPVLSEWPVAETIAPAASGLNLHTTGVVLVNAMLNEYIPFIILLFTLYTISGGIRIAGDLPAHPGANAAFLAVGAILASFIGTTGAAMLLIRPLLETNRERKHVKHTVVFFIFAVCNCGGCLLPLGDPPLFLGYLKNVPFLWTLKLWPAWLFVNVSLVAVYYLYDRLWYYPHEARADVARDETRVHRLTIAGLWPNLWLLLGVVLSIALLDPAKPVPGTAWHPWIYLREAVQLALVVLSLALGTKSIRRANNFSFHAITEVAALFFGIFICMQAPLQLLHVQGPALGLTLPHHFFWASGSLSSVLDNAPTYVVFFETAKSLGGTGLVAGVQEALLVGVSLGSVFMGAMTYIGNGPNFMVKAIAEKSGVAMPSFFGYMVYSFVFLLPLFYLTTRFFL